MFDRLANNMTAGLPENIGNPAFLFDLLYGVVGNNSKKEMDYEV